MRTSYIPDQTVELYLKNKNYNFKFELLSNLKITIMGEICSQINNSINGIAPMYHFTGGDFYVRLANQINCLTGCCYSGGIVTVNISAEEMIFHIVTQKNNDVRVDAFWVKF